MPHKFQPKDMARLESPERAQWLDPKKTLDALGVGPGTVLADVGCGPGVVAIPAAERVGPGGQVYAVDISQEMLDRVKEKAAAGGIDNLTPILSEESRVSLPDGAVDLVLLVNVLHETENVLGLLRECRRILGPRGRLAAVDWRKESTEKGPPVEDRLASGQVIEAAKAAGLSFSGTFEPGPYSYGLVFTGSTG